MSKKKKLTKKETAAEEVRRLDAMTPEEAIKYLGALVANVASRQRAPSRSTYLPRIYRLNLRH